MFKVGDHVRIRTRGSWCDGRRGVIEALSVLSSDGISGHTVRVESGEVTVIEPELLKPLRTAKKSMTRRELFRALGLRLDPEGEPEAPVVVRVAGDPGHLLRIARVERPAGPDGEWVICVSWD